MKNDNTVIRKLARTAIPLPYATDYEALSKEMSDTNITWLKNERLSAISNFNRLGIPNKKDENWKYSNLLFLAETTFFIDETNTKGYVKPEVLKNYPKLDPQSQRLVFINSCLDFTLSDDIKDKDNITISMFSEVNETKTESLVDQITLSNSLKENALPMLNIALMSDGYAISLAPSSSLKIELLFITKPSSPGYAYHPRVTIIGRTESQATIVERHVSLGGQKYWSNPLITIELDSSAKLDHYKVVNDTSKVWHTAFTKVLQCSASSYKSFVLATSPLYMRNQIDIKLKEPNADCELNGAFLANENQEIDNHIQIDHLAPACDSKVIYKGVLDDKAKGVFQARTIVRPDSQKTSGEQLSRTLMLSSAALMTTKPELKIYADDVKCGHGATIGELDDDMVFYLQSRGINKKDAKNLLITAFIQENLNTIKHDVTREEFSASILSWLRNK